MPFNDKHRGKWDRHQSTPSIASARGSKLCIMGPRRVIFGIGQATGGLLPGLTGLGPSRALKAE